MCGSGDKAPPDGMGAVEPIGGTTVAGLFAGGMIVVGAAAALW